MTTRPRRGPARRRGCPKWSSGSCDEVCERRSLRRSPRARRHPASAATRRPRSRRPPRESRSRRPRRSPDSACPRDGIVVAAMQTACHSVVVHPRNAFRRRRWSPSPRAPRAAARTIVRDARADRLVGTAAADVIRGRGGGDLVFGATGSGLAPRRRRARRDRRGAGNDLCRPSTTPRRTRWLRDGLDVVNADLRDRVARDCELVGRRLSRDPYTTPDAQHETRGRAGQLHRRVDDGHDLPGRPALRRGRDERRLRGHPRRRPHWASGLLPGLTLASRPAGREREGERPGRGVRRGAPRLAHLHPRPRRTTTRLAINRSTDGATWRTRSSRPRRPSLRALPSTRTGSPATTRRRRPTSGAAISPSRTPSDRDMLAVAGRPTAGSAGRRRRHRGRSRLSGLPGVGPSGELVVVYLWGEARSRSLRRAPPTAG